LLAKAYAQNGQYEKAFAIAQDAYQFASRTFEPEDAAMIEALG